MRSSTEGVPLDENARAEMALRIGADIAYYKLILPAREAGLLDLNPNSCEYAAKDAEIIGIKLQILALEDMLASL